MFGRLVVQGPKRGGRPAMSWVECLQKISRPSGRSRAKAKDGRGSHSELLPAKDGRDWIAAAKNVDMWHRGVERGAEALDSAWRRADLSQSSMQRQREDISQESSGSQDSEYISSEYNSKSSDDSSATDEERKDSDQEAGEDEDSSDDHRRTNTKITDEGSKLHDEEEGLAKKREDFEKMQELAAHMDNVVRRLSKLFPLNKVGDHTTAPPRGTVPGLPPIPSPNKPQQTRVVSASPRTTMDRAVSARKMPLTVTIDRAVSVASDLPLDDGLPVFVGDNLTDSAGKGNNITRGQEINKAPGDSRRAWGRADGEVGRCKGSTSHNGQETAVRDARRRSTPSSGERQDDSVETSSIEMMQQPRYPKGRSKGSKRSNSNPTGGKGAHHVGRSSPRKNVVEGLCEQKLWDERRESLMGRGRGREGHVPGSWFADTGKSANSEERRDDKYDKAAEKQRRKLIDEAIAILLEPSSCDEDELECNGGV